jgi:hypothetical protein
MSHQSSNKSRAIDATIIARINLIVLFVLSVFSASCSSPVETRELHVIFEDSVVTELYVDKPDGVSLRLIAGGTDNLAINNDNGEWELVLQDTGYVYEIAAAGSQVFAATQNGLFGSIDGSVTWFKIAPDQFTNVSAVAANETSEGDFLLAIVATHASRGRGTFVTTEIDGTWSSGSGGPDRSISILADNTIVGAKDEAIVWAKLGNTLDWRPIPTGDEIGVSSADGANQEDFVAFVSNSRSQEVSVLTVHGGINSIRTLSYSLAERSTGCNPSAGGYGSADQCFEEVLLSNEFQSDGTALLISPNELLISHDFGREWNPKDLPDNVQIQAAALFADDIYAITDGSKLWKTNSRQHDWQNITLP